MVHYIPVSTHTRVTLVLAADLDETGRVTATKLESHLMSTLCPNNI